MASASLTIRIAADINDFSKQLNKLTKDVAKAADQIAAMGNGLTLALTAPVALATVALAKLAVENDRVAQQFERSFGPAAKKVHEQLTQLMGVIPKTATDLEEAAIKMNNFAKGLGFAAPQAAQLSIELLKMSADLAAFSGTNQEDALDAMMRGLMGTTKGLKSMGVSLTSAMVEQEAFRLGLVKTGQELTPVGTALATYNLLVKQSANWNGEAGKVAESAQGQWRMLWRDMIQLADDASNVLIPALRQLAGVLRQLILVIRDTPTWLLKTIAALAVLGAVIGPVITLVAKLIKVFNLLMSIVTILAGAGGMARLVALLAAPEIVGALAIIGVAVAGLTYLWKKFNDETAKVQTPNAEDIAPPIDVKALLGLGGENDPSAFIKGDPLQQLQKAASLTSDAFEMAVNTGDQFEAQLDRILNIQKEAYQLWEKSSDKFDEMAQGALKVYFQLREIRTVAGVAFGGKSAGAGSRALTSDNAIAMQLARGLIDEQTQLRVREAAIQIADAFDASRVALLEYAEQQRATARDLATREARMKLPMAWNEVRRGAAVEHAEQGRAYQADLLRRSVQINLPNYFDALRQATVELGEEFRNTENEFSLGWQKLKQQWSSPSMIGKSAMAGFEGALASATASLGPAALAFMAIGKVLDPIFQLLNMVMEPLTAFGKILALIIQPVMWPLFEALKALGIVTSFLGEVFYRIASGVAHALGGLITAIGKMIAKIPFLGGVGRSIQRFGEWIEKLGDDAQNHANALKKARDQLIGLDLGETTDGINDLGDAARDTAEALLNVPTGFRIALERFRATMPVDSSPITPPPIGGPITPGNGPTGGTGVGGGDSGGDRGETAVFLMMDGNLVARGVVKNLQRIAQAQLGSTIRWSEVTP